MIYAGTVEHTRHLPVYHHFQYPVYMYAIDLDELGLLDKKLPFFGYNRLRPSSINDADYLEKKPGSIKEKLLDLLPEANRARTATVTLVTSARYFNYIFNPVCFYYCFDAKGEMVCLVAEVSNTYGERHVYLPKPAASESSEPKIFKYTAEKAFHVSPFNNMAGRYHFFCTLPGQTIDMAIHLVRDGEKTFEARFQAKGRDLTRATHIGVLLRHPVMPHLTMPRIIFQAMRLYYQKHMPWHDKPAPADPMTIRYKR
jgi:cyclopropane-fatty-acyl-phospholipid synthase